MKPERFPEWWPGFERAQLVSGPSGEVGAVYAYRVRGSAGLAFDFTLQIHEKRAPHYLHLLADGDFSGTGIWSLAGHGSQTHVTYVWKVKVTRWWPRLLSYIPGVRRYLERSHDKVMALGYQNLRRVVLEQNS